MKSFPVYYVDAFTNQPFMGNPCAVLPMAAGLSTDQMQLIARETNLNETAFVFPSTQADYRLRFFSTKKEIPFAGHPTIATAFLLAEKGFIDCSENITTIHFEFKIGVLPVEIEAELGRPIQIVTTLPAPTFGETIAPDEVAACFNLLPSDFRDDSPIQVVSAGAPYLIVPLRTLDATLRAESAYLKVSSLLRQVGVSTVFLFCLESFSKNADVFARMFDPDGVGEDPFCGAGSGSMAAYVYHYHLSSKPFLCVEQGHLLGRPGKGEVEIRGDSENILGIRLKGSAVRVMDGQFWV